MNEKEEAFTPGPWRVSSETVTDLQRPLVEACNGDPVAVMSFPDKGDCAANAALIAAAPALYEALKAVTSAYQHARDAWGSGDCAVLRKARAALSAAKQQD